MSNYQECVKCGKENDTNSCAYCENCGVPLENYCSNENCITREDEGFSLPNDVCYCGICGEKSFYYVEGYIEPQNYKK